MIGYKGAHKRTIDNTGIVKITRLSAIGAMIAALVLGFLAAFAPAAFAAGECDAPNFTKIDEPSGTATLPFGSAEWGGDGESTENSIILEITEGYTVTVCLKSSTDVVTKTFTGPGTFTFDTGTVHDISHIGYTYDYEEPPVTPEGSNNSSSPACEQITVGTPTGVKPEDATVVVKLNGEVTQPGTYDVAPGEHTVTTYVNGELVDTDTVTVTKCEDEVVPEGNLNVSSTCESITFSSTGVKPEDAEQIFKLDGVVKAPGTYPVAAGSHTVELFVNGEKVDSETVTVEECEEPPVTPEGSNNSSSSVCKQIIVGQPTGVKPEGATVVVKLDNVVTQPGTYATTPGSHVVTTFVNGTLVDTDTVVVTDCPVVPPVVVPPVVVPPVVTPPVVTPPVVTPPVKRDNPSASVKARCVTAHWGEGEANLNNKRSDVRNTFRIIMAGPDKVVSLKADKKRSVNLTGLPVGSVVKVKSGGELLAKTKVPAGCGEETPDPDTGFRMVANPT